MTLVLVWLLLHLFLVIIGNTSNAMEVLSCTNVTLECKHLQPGQYYCSDPLISPDTQSEDGCSESKRTVEVLSAVCVAIQNCGFECMVIQVDCFPVSGICCDGQLHTGDTVGFKRDVPCRWTQLIWLGAIALAGIQGMNVYGIADTSCHKNKKKFSVALLLSIFLGWLGIDRFYLGYPALGMLKFCTFGFMLIWTLIDILLIAIQVVGPADGSDYIIDYYGPGLTHILADNSTYIVPPGGGI